MCLVSHEMLSAEQGVDPTVVELGLKEAEAEAKASVAWSEQIFRDYSQSPKSTHDELFFDTTLLYFLDEFLDEKHPWLRLS